MAIAATENLSNGPRFSDGAVGTFLIILWFAMVLILWGFAFMPAPESSREWVLQAQSACFGTLPNGLPGSGGWIILILSPLALLSVMWAAHAEELQAAIPYIRKSRFSQTTLVSLFLIMLLVGHWTGTRITYASRISMIGTGQATNDPLPEDYMRLSLQSPQFNLINQNGEMISQNVFNGKVTILTFAFAHCSSICPVLIRDVLMAQKTVASADLQSVIVSLDPWRDTPNTLASAAKSWSIKDNAHMLSGSPEEVTKALDGFQIKSIRNPKNGDVNHAAQVLIVNKRGQVVYSFLNPSVGWLTTAAARILNEP